jgi:hypothetical protein
MSAPCGPAAPFVSRCVSRDSLYCQGSSNRSFGLAVMVTAGVPTLAPPGRRERARRRWLSLREWPRWHRPLVSRATRIGIVSMGAPASSLQQFSPLYQHRRRIHRELNAVIRTAWIDPTTREVPSWLADADVVLLQLNHFLPLANGLEVIEKLRALRSGAPLLYYDGDDDAGVAWPETADRCDLLVKGHLYRDRAWYLRTFVGKCNLTDHVAREFGVSFAVDTFPHSRPLAERSLPKLWLGWNIGCSRVVGRFRPTDVPWHDRTTDVILRSSVHSDWTSPLRQPALDALRRLSPEHSVILPDRRVDHATYCREMSTSKLSVSPFGYGELCYRDFETVLAGCVLLKPSVDHLETQPDLFRAGETSEQVRWDFSDLHEVVAHSLANEQRAVEMSRRASRELDRWTSGDEVLRNFAGQLRAVNAIR